MKFFYGPEKRMVKRVAIITATVVFSLFLFYFFSNSQTGLISLTGIENGENEIYESTGLITHGSIVEILSYFWHFGLSNLSYFWQI